MSLRQATCLGDCVGICMCVREHAAVSNENKHKCVSRRGSTLEGVSSLPALKAAVGFLGCWRCLKASSLQKVLSKRSM